FCVLSFALPCRRGLVGLHSFPTRRSADLAACAAASAPARGAYARRRRRGRRGRVRDRRSMHGAASFSPPSCGGAHAGAPCMDLRSEEHTSELQSRSDLVCRLLLEKKNTIS